ncbi:hypothetical protein MPEAHAMD_1587 [Methylobacterium frigidaeris]|uniref:Uncharacterized protein n=1 Tax=Methylobacterium frigidaeris TaxID=2038277 RepID=A0AA37H8T6_9HYPH|nr:hypothetical protein MPEAHAMD_1587 [Methylobacterium frigidaeris]
MPDRIAIRAKLIGSFAVMLVLMAGLAGQALGRIQA